MALKTVLESLDDVQEDFKPLYVESDGKFVLDLDEIDAHPDVSNLKSAYKAEKDKRTTVGAKLTAAQKAAEEAEKRLAALPDDFDPDEWKRLKNGKPDGEAVIAMREKLEAELAAAQKKVADMEANTRRIIVERDLDEALQTAGITEPIFLKASRLMLAERVQTSDAGDAFVESDLGPVPLTTFAKQFAAGEGKQFVTPPKGGGSGGSDRGSGDKTISRTDFDALKSHEKRKKLKDGVRVVNT